MQLQNPIGFGTGDFIELALAVLLVLLAILWPRYVEPALRRLSAHPGSCLALFVVLPVALRLVLLRQHPAPDTLRIETTLIPAEWALVLAEMAAACALCYVAVRRLLGPYPGLIAGLLAVFWLGPLHHWANSYSNKYLLLSAGLVLLSLLPGVTLRTPPRGALRLLLYLLIAEFALRFGSAAFHPEPPHRRAIVAKQLEQIPGRLLVIVRYWPHHPVGDDWVRNVTDTAAARIVFAHDLGEPGNERFARIYSDRKLLTLEPDATPPRVLDYRPTPPPPPPVPEPAPQKDIIPGLRLEQVR